MFANRYLFAAAALLLFAMTLSADAVTVINADAHYATFTSTPLWDLAVLVLGLAGTILAIDALVQTRSVKHIAQEAKTMAEEAKRLALWANVGNQRAQISAVEIDASLV